MKTKKFCQEVQVYVCGDKKVVLLETVEKLLDEVFKQFAPDNHNYRFSYIRSNKKLIKPKEGIWGAYHNPPNGGL